MPVQLLRIAALIAFGIAIYLFLVDQLALGAALIAVGFMMLGVSFAASRRGPGSE